MTSKSVVVQFEKRLKSMISKFIISMFHKLTIFHCWQSSRLTIGQIFPSSCTYCQFFLIQGILSRQEDIVALPNWRNGFLQRGCSDYAPSVPNEWLAWHAIILHDGLHQLVVVPPPPLGWEMIRMEPISVNLKGKVVIAGNSFKFPDPTKLSTLRPKQIYSKSFECTFY